jgi:hypothetical protein
VHLALAGRAFDDVERRKRALAHVVLEALVGELGVRVDPGDDEHRQALVHAPLDEGFFRREIEDVELVDPGRHDQQRPLEHRRGRGRVLDELHQLVFEDDLAGRAGEIAADLEHRGARLADLEVAVSGLDVLGQHVHAAHEVLGLGRERLAQQLRIGEHEIGRGDRVGDLAHVEIGLLLDVRVEPFGVMHQPVGPLHRQKIGLLEEIEELVGRPFGVGEAPVPRVGRGDGLHLLAGHAPGHMRPEVEIGLAQLRLHLQRALRIAQPIVRDLAEGFHHVGHLGVLVVDLAFFPRLEVGGERLAAFFHHPGDVAGELLDLDRAGFDRF